MIEAQPSPIAQRIRRASAGSSGARTAARSEQGPSGEPGGIRPSPRRPAQADRRRIACSAVTRKREWPQGGAQPNDAGQARSLRDLFAEGRALQAETTEAREPCGTRPASVRATGPRKTAGGRGCSVSGGGFQAGGPEGRRHYKRNWPPRGCPQRASAASERGWVSPPADDPHKKGAPPKGGRRGENPGGGNRGLPPPRRAKTRTARAGAGTTARPQPRRRRDSASSRWRGAWARLYPASAASGKTARIMISGLLLQWLHHDRPLSARILKDHHMLTRNRLRNILRAFHHLFKFICRIAVRYSPTDNQLLCQFYIMV